MTHQPLKITIVAGPFYPTPPAPTGAVQRVWSDLAGRFATRGHDVEIIAKRFPGQAREEQRSDGVRIRRRTNLSQGTNIKLDLLKDLYYSARMFLMARRADILVTNAFWMPAIARFRPRIGRPYVSVQRMPKGQMKLYRKVGRLHAVSQAVADAIIEEQPSLQPLIKVLPNPIDTCIFCPPPAGRPQRHTRTILYTGRIHPEKGMEVLINAFRTLNPEQANLRLKLMGASSINQGGGGDAYVASLQSLAGNLPVEIAAPVFGREALAAELQNADFYVYPSLAEKGETFGVAPLEAMATGLAPVVSDLGCFKDFILHERTGLIFNHREPDPAAALAAQLRRLIDDPALAQRLGAQGALDARPYGYDEVADRFLTDFREVLGHS